MKAAVVERAFSIIQKFIAQNPILINNAGMDEELRHLGQRLKQARESRNLSLKEIENATSIRTGLLQSIEEGNLKNLISPIYAQGFIKKYAALLEMDGDKMIAEYPHLKRYFTQKRTEDFFPLSGGTLEVRGSPAGEMKWLPNLLWVGGSMLAILTLWFLLRFIGFF